MNTPDLHNPYAPPVDAELNLDQPGKQPSPEPMRARRDTRACLLLLMLPATMNWVFYRIAFGPARVPHQEMLFQLAAAGLGGLLLWLYLLNALELATKLLHWPLGKQPLQRWQGLLYRSLRSTPYLTAAGAILWIIWNIGFYVLFLPFLLISIPVGILAHLLGACFYVPLFYRWYRLERPSESTL